MATGIVKFVQKDGAFCFITPDGGGADLVAYPADIAGESKKFTALQKVSFDETMGPKGRQAINIQLQ
ncbi:hypothetical protein BK666_27075 [Pseudomonas frederiksbergensis]|uniref:CSD domain-containing protein n=1 Tax=Pseudomonas frederiksbergensis TaxID=104087 RepID=A0A423JQF9_9PSED|nr:cold shock domain-containing protein [Pseudomonas frederiksbergensis]RON39894.1 hypothetical protein BK666_27075 [Pseudomonas frederiksbergensis]